MESFTGVRGGDTETGVGSRVERAAAVLSPRSSAPRLLDFRRGRGMFDGDGVVMVHACRFIPESS